MTRVIEVASVQMKSSFCIQMKSSFCVQLGENEYNVIRGGSQQLVKAG